MIGGKPASIPVSMAETTMRVALRALARRFDAQNVIHNTLNGSAQNTTLWRVADTYALARDVVVSLAEASFATMPAAWEAYLQHIADIARNARWITTNDPSLALVEIHIAHEMTTLINLLGEDICLVLTAAKKP